RFSPCSQPGARRQAQNPLPSLSAAVEVAGKVVPPNPSIHNDQFDLVAIIVEPCLGRPARIAAVGTCNSHGKSAAIGALHDSIECDPEVVASQRNGWGISPAIHVAAVDIEASRSAAVETLHRGIYFHPGIIRNARARVAARIPRPWSWAAWVTGAGPIATVGPRTIVGPFHPIRLGINDAIVICRSPGVRTANTITQSATDTLSPIGLRVEVPGIEVEVYASSRVGADPLGQGVLALDHDGLRTAILALRI